MSKISDAIADAIWEAERETLDNIMRDIARNIQADFVQETYNALDQYYQEYNRPPRQYIRTDELKKGSFSKYIKVPTKNGNFRLKNQNGKFTEIPKRYSDVSLWSAITTEGAIGICDELQGMYGYQAGVLFDESYFSKEDNMKHSVMGDNFSEWDIVENFLEGQHGNGSKFSEPFMSESPASLRLQALQDNYKTKFDKHYKDACKKYR